MRGVALPPPKELDMKSRWWVRYGLSGAAVTALGCGLLAGCGDDSNQGGAGATGTDAASTTAATSVTSTHATNSAASTSVASTSAQSSSSGGGMKALGESCATSDECAGGLCLTEESSFGWAGGYCSQLCDARFAPCLEGDCLSLLDNTSFCIKPCDPDSSTDCTGVGKECYNLGSVQNPANYCVGGCAESDCAATSHCDPTVSYAGGCVPVEQCSGGVDDDGDGFVDCEDPDCAEDATCITAIGSACGGATDLVFGSPNMGTTAGDTLFAGSCGLGGAPEQLYDVTAPSDGVMVLTLASADDLGLSLRTSCEDASSEVVCVDQVYGGQTERLLQNVTAGDTFTLLVDGYQAGREGDFTVNASMVPVNAETEPNDDLATANTIALTSGIGFMSAATNPTDDEDWFTFTLTTASAVRISTGSFGGSTCGGDIDTMVELYQNDGSTLIDQNDDINNGNYCSSLTTMDPLDPGTYTVHVFKSPTALDPAATFEYLLEVFTL